jgi:hypothetical protein
MDANIIGPIETLVQTACTFVGLATLLVAFVGVPIYFVVLVWKGDR